MVIIQDCLIINLRKSLEWAGGNLTYFPNHQSVIKDWEIKVDDLIINGYYEIMHEREHCQTFHDWNKNSFQRGND